MFRKKQNSKEIGATQKHEGAVVWFTGLSGAGKTTISKALYTRMKKIGWNADRLDGDAIRHLFPNIGFSKQDRDAHIRRVGYMSSRLAKHGVIVVASLISPYMESRNFVKGICSNFIEIYLSTPLDVCESRDPKGLYKKARAGEISNFTGLDDPYEPPDDAAIIINTADVSVDDAVDRILSILKNKVIR